MHPTYSYAKERRQFGRQCLFSDRNELLFNEPSNRLLFENYILRDPVHRDTQKEKQFALSVVNTDNVEYSMRGINHTEGGWPKDLNYLDSEQTLRYRKKIERDDIWGQQVLALTKPMEKCIQQNSAVNIYEYFFEGLDPLPEILPWSARNTNVYMDPKLVNRPVTSISWEPEGGNKFVCAYFNRNFLADQIENSTAYIWDTENPNKPVHTLTEEYAASCFEYNPKEIHSIACGFGTGQVGYFDIRAGKEVSIVSQHEYSHRERVSSLLWTTSKSNSEFFTGSPGGSILWWDTRKLNEPIDKVLLDTVKTDIQDRSRAHGASVLEFEPTIPTRFMVGTDQGYVFSCNKKGQTPTEKIISKVVCHAGPINTLERNPAFVKNFLTVGDWQMKIFAEECHDSPIMWSSSQCAQLNGGAWSLGRSSLLFIIRSDGILDFWDILSQHKSPVYSMKLGHFPLSCLRVHENGRLVAVGSSIGNVMLVEVDDLMSISDKNDKVLLSAMFERETRREKILEGKIRELKLKAKAIKDQEERLQEEQRQLQEEEERKVQEEEDRKVREEEEARLLLEEEEIKQKEDKEKIPDNENEAKLILEEDADQKEGDATKPVQKENEFTEAPIKQPVVTDLVELADIEFFKLVSKENNRRNALIYEPVETDFEFYVRRKNAIEADKIAREKARNKENTQPSTPAVDTST